MDDQPPPEPWVSSVRGTKRSHSQMTIGEPSTTITRTTERPDSANSTAASSSSSGNHSPATAAPEAPLVRLPSFSELDRDIVAAFERRRQVPPVAQMPAAPPMETIDLTGDEVLPPNNPAPLNEGNLRRLGEAQRGPRFPADIIDLSEDADTPAPIPAPSPERQRESPDVQIIRERHLPNNPPQPNPRRSRNAPERWAQQIRDQEARGLHAQRMLEEEVARAREYLAIEIPDDAEDDVTVVRHNQIRPPRVRGIAPRIQVTAQDRLFTGIQGVRRMAQEIGGQMRPNLPYARAMARLAGNRFIGELDFAPPDMDYDAPPAFLLGADEEPAALPPSPYVAPSPPAEGFTRSPEEDDELGCPRCGDELGTGATDQKKEVWIAVGCGHVFCGECAASRLEPKNSRGNKRRKVSPALAARKEPMGKCVVEGCGKRTTAKQMIRLFLH